MDLKGLSIFLFIFSCSGTSANLVSSSEANEANKADPRAKLPDAWKGDPSEIDEPVQMKAVANYSRVSPGQEIVIAARFLIAPKWHMYWENPGDAGLPTEVAFKASVGTIEPQPQPGPKKFVAFGDIVGFGYEKELLLSAKFKVPEIVPKQGITVSIHGEWLACLNSCIPGQDDIALTLLPATRTKPAAPAYQEIFSAHTKALPKPFQLLEGATAHWKLGKQHSVLIISLPGDQNAIYYPGRAEYQFFEGQAKIPEADTTEIRVSFASSAPSLVASGVLEILPKNKSSSFYKITSTKPELP